MSYKLIISADDFGISPSVNRAIVDAFANHLITNTTLMVNMPYADEAIELAKANDFWDKVGLHINLIEGKPLNSNICKNRYFGSPDQKEFGDNRLSFINRFILPRQVGNEIYKEVELQIQKFMQYEPYYLHVDSHKHMHTNWSIYKMCKPLFLKYSIKSVRLTRNFYKYKNPKKCTPKNIYKNIYNNDICRHNWSNVDLFGSFDEFLELQKRNPEMLNEKRIELMCHPDYIDGKLVNKGCSVGFEELMECIHE